MTLSRERFIDDTFVLCGTDKGALGHGYAPIYAKIQPEITSMLEVGVYRGGSLRAWLEIFPQAEIYGIDINPLVWPKMEVHPRIHFTQADIREFNADSLPQFDLIIDDGSHKLEDMVAAFDKLKSHLKPGGTYVIEDVMEASMLDSFPGCEMVERDVKQMLDDRVIVWRAK